MATTKTIEQMLGKALRDMAALRREMHDLRALINADIRTADRLISVSEACRILGKKKSAVYSMISSGKIPARRNERGRYQLSFNQLQKYIHS